MQMNEMVMGGSVSVWKLLILLLSAEFTRSRSSAIDEAEKDDQLDEAESTNSGFPWTIQAKKKSGNQPLVVRYNPFSSLLDSNENIIVLLRSLSTRP